MHPSLHARLRPHAPAIVQADGTVTATFADLERRSNQGAQLFRRLGLEAGAGIALLLENHPRYLEVCWAAQRSGLVYTPISTQLQPDEIAHILTDCGARLLVTSAAMLAAGKIPGAIAVPHRFAVDGPADGFASWPDALAACPAEPIGDEAAGADMPYTSGTTGRPKGVRPAAIGGPIDAATPSLLMARDRYGFAADTRFLCPVPLYHAAPLRNCMRAQSWGGAVVLQAKFAPEPALAAIERCRITHSLWVPTLFVRLLGLADEVRAAYDLSTHRVAIHTAAPCPPDVKRRMIAWWGPILHEYYGGSEGIGMTSIDSRDWLARPGSVGRAEVGRIVILDEAGAELPPGAVGLVCFADGPAFRYHSDPAKTAAAHPRPGCATMGDLGYVDADGFLHLLDRKDFMIISGGVNIYPQEAENVLLGHHAVVDAAVIGVPDPEFGETVKAVVQPLDLTAAGPALAAELIAYCRARLAHLKCPRSVDFVAELPRQPNGKLLKRLIRDRYWHRPSGA